MGQVLFFLSLALSSLDSQEQKYLRETRVNVIPEATWTPVLFSRECVMVELGHWREPYACKASLGSTDPEQTTAGSPNHKSLVPLPMSNLEVL